MLVIFGISLFVNLLSIYNVGIAYLSFFFFVQFFIPRVFIKIISFAENREKTVSSSLTKFLVAYGNHPIIRTLNLVVIIISLIVLVIGSIGLVAIQLFFKQEISYFLSHSLNIDQLDMVLHVLSYLGYTTFVIGLILILKDSILILKKEPLFNIS